jgi:biopolymer transport protein TolR
MAMAVGGPSGGVKSDINVTPLVDVMLVLLIIMMIVAPMLQKGVDVRLPVAANSADKPETVLAIKADKTLYVNGIRVQAGDLRQKVEEALETKKEKVILIKADEDVEYGAVMGAMDSLREGGIEDMGLITERKVKPGEAGGK